MAHVLITLSEFIGGVVALLMVGGIFLLVAIGLGSLRLYDGEGEMASRNTRETCGVVLTDALRALGWRDLDQLPPDDEPVLGLLSNGWTCDAEWWDAVPEELQSPDDDGSGWAWSGLVLDGDVALIAWQSLTAPDTSERPDLAREEP